MCYLTAVVSLSCFYSQPSQNQDRKQMRVLFEKYPFVLFAPHYSQPSSIFSASARGALSYSATCTEAFAVFVSLLLAELFLAWSASAYSQADRDRTWTFLQNHTWSQRWSHFSPQIENIWPFRPYSLSGQADRPSTLL